MRRKTHTTTIALCASLSAHALGLSALAWWVVMTTPRPREAAIDRNVVMLEQLSREMALQPKPATKAPAIQPAPKPAEKKPAPPLPKEAEKFQKPDDPFKDDSGEHDGAGEANRTNHGDKPMQAPQASVAQADLMKQDASKFDDDAFMPASAGKKDDENSNSPLTSKAGDAAHSSDEKSNATQLNDAKSNGAKANETKSNETKLNETDDPAVLTLLAMASDKGTLSIPRPVNPSPAVPSSVVPSSVVPSPTVEKNPAKERAAQSAKPPSDLKEVRGKKTEISDTESAALSKSPALTYQSGQLLGRKGLKVQTREPRYGYASEVDLESLGDPSTVMGVKLDPDGNVLDVKLLESSGSSNIDHDRMLAVWHWVLEPTRDKDGSITDLLWTVTIR